MSRFVKLTEIREVNQRWPSNTKKYELKEVVLNSNSISVIRDGSFYKKEIKSYKGWPEGLDERIFITEISTDNEKIIYAIGDLENIIKKLGGYSG